MNGSITLSMTKSSLGRGPHVMVEAADRTMMIDKSKLACRD